MRIDKFKRDEFGTLTTITSPTTGVVMFVAKEIAESWGHTNLTQAIKRALFDENDFKKIELSKYPEFKKELTNSMLIGARSSSITLLTESGMYKLALISNLEKAKIFRNWITEEVLPSIRKKGYYSIADSTKSITMHTNVSVQKTNSKDINTKNFNESGLDAVIQYNKKNCQLHTGKTPVEIKQIGKDAGLKSIERNSAKQVLRNLKPELACAMSFTDSLVKEGFDLETVSELSLRAAVPLFQGMLELGAKPAELSS